MEDAISQFLNKKAEGADEYALIIESMMNNPEAYGFAEATLVGIYDFIKENGYISDKQITTINNIKDSIYGRRYRGSNSKTFRRRS